MTPTRETFGNIPPASKAAFYVLAVVAMAVFAWGVWRRFQLWRQGQPINAKELFVGNLKQILAKLKPGVRRVVVEGFGQGRVRSRRNRLSGFRGGARRGLATVERQAHRQEKHRPKIEAALHKYGDRSGRHEVRAGQTRACVVPEATGVAPVTSAKSAFYGGWPAVSCGVYVC